jgi:hypothetical protein
MSDDDSRPRSRLSTRPPDRDAARPSERPSAERSGPRASERPPARNGARVSERAPARRPASVRPGHVEDSDFPDGLSEPPLRDHTGQIIELGESGDGRMAPPVPAHEWRTLQHTQAAAVLVALLIEAVLPSVWLITLVTAGCLGYALQKLPQGWTRPGPLGLGWTLVLTRAALTVALPPCYALAGPYAALGAVVGLVLMTAAAPILVERAQRPHPLELVRCVGADVDAFGVAVLSATLHASGQLGPWVLFAGALRFMHVLALGFSGADLARPRGPAAFFAPLTLLMLGSGLLPMPLLYVPICALATIATALVYGALTLRHAR